MTIFQPDVRPLGYVLHADAEIPGGAVNGTNTTFMLLNSPTPGASLRLYLNGVVQTQGTDYTLSANVVTFTTAPAFGGTLIGWYRF